MSPLSLIPKPGWPVNHCIAAEDFPTAWGKFSIIYNLIAHLPPGSEAATRDVAEAYRTIPLHPSQQPANVVRISESLGCINTSLAFGATPAAGVYGHLSDACCEILHHHGIGPLDKWVDDHIFFHIHKEHLAAYSQTCLASYQDILQHDPSPKFRGSRLWFQGHTRSDTTSVKFTHDALFSYSMQDLDLLSENLSIPWEPSKDQPFHHSTIYISFEWDLHDMKVSLSASKTAKYLEAIAAWLS
ncbi:hypothetical protein ID866_11731 [Astraeus odoratus]|nr:hypothetical protein ID866_11731 [Astraeus odoratus]